MWLVAFNMAPTTKKVRIKIMSRKKLGSGCSALGCNMTSGTNTLSKIKMYRYPKDEDRRRAWLIAVQREGLQPGKNLRLCSNHFITGAPSADPWNPDYVPSIFAHKTTADGSQKLEQKQMRKKRKPVVKSNDSPSLEVSHTDPNKQCTAAGTDLSMADIDRLQKENIELKRKVAVLEKTLKSQENDYKIVCWAVCPNCFCVFQPRPLPDDKVESIIDHPCHSRAVSCGNLPGESSSRLK